MTRPAGRPAGDHRTAEQIIEQSSLLRRFLYSSDHFNVVDDLKRVVGDWTEINPDPHARAHAAYHLDKVMRFIDNLNPMSASDTRNGVIDGFSDYGYGTQDNSEARLFSEFSNRGYTVLRWAGY
ncbi:hypothetical protein HX855_11685 [Pseudomonas sp. IPO3778]|nr:hypothetical protein [Pseudomonas sp. IPO3779]NWD17443.1 hypothetical protein [Pseudomonas sp. IPO3778]